jgi:hypothetical protein
LIVRNVMTAFPREALKCRPARDTGMEQGWPVKNGAGLAGYPQFPNPSVPEYLHDRFYISRRFSQVDYSYPGTQKGDGQGAT